MLSTICFVLFMIAVGCTNAQASYNQSSVIEYFAGDDCISSANNVVGMVIDYVELPGGRPAVIPPEVPLANAVLDNIVFDPPFIANNQSSYNGDILTAVLPIGVMTTVVQSFTVNGVNFRQTFTITVGGLCDIPPTTTAAY